MPLDRILRHLIAWQRADGPRVPDRDLPIEEARARYRANATRDRGTAGAPPPAVRSADRVIDVAGGPPLRVRVYTPERDGGRAVTYLHGGGWALGDLDSHDRPCRALAASLDAVVVSADYRRAPEHPYPAALHDAVAAARWTAGAFPGRDHVLAGDSAGASLALGAAFDARDAGGPEPAALLLLYPPADPSLRIAASCEHPEGYLLSVDDMAWYYAQYVPDPGRRGEPAVDLLNADLGGLPPAVLATAEFDPLRDEGEALAGKMRASGVRVRYVPGPGLVHGYFLMQDIVPAAAEGARRVVQELDGILPPRRDAPDGAAPRRPDGTAEEK